MTMCMTLPGGTSRRTVYPRIPTVSSPVNLFSNILKSRFFLPCDHMIHLRRMYFAEEYLAWTCSWADNWPYRWRMLLSVSEIVRVE